jgi:DNA polymerase-3 subunit epsilon
VISLDIETTGLDPHIHEVWEVGLVDLETEAEHLWELPVLRLDRADAGALQISDYYGRNSIAPGTPQARNIVPSGGTEETPEDVAFAIARMTAGEIIMGCAVHFDLEFLGAWLTENSAAPAWHHRHLDLGSYAAGKLGAAKPLSSKAMADRIANDDPHTALGDARWNVRVYQALETGELS